MNLRSFGPFIIAHLVLPCLVLAAEPRSILWSEDSIGPDGPWNVVEVTIGQSSMLVFAGGTWETSALTQDYCDNGDFGASPKCAAAGYDDNIESPDTKILYMPEAEKLSAGLKIDGSATTIIRDTVDFEWGSVTNHSVTLIDDQYILYPNGDKHPLPAGCFSVGAQDASQEFGDDGEVKAPLIPWALKEDDEIPSASFGLHIGSAVDGAKMSGSLVFGGYDRNRLVGDVLKLRGTFRDTIRLLDISIKVVAGDSPFGFADSKSNLLTKGTSSSSRQGLGILLEPCSPYLTLPKATCEKIEEHLPLTYNEDLGLYLWDVDDDQYKSIVHSASTLSFEFMGSANTETITIDLPFRHLDLTLETPLVTTPTQYFPCSTGGDKKAVLGRAFFQDAFLGGNWEQRVWWLGQAPGPNIQSSPQISSIDPDAEEIESGDNDWKQSWSGIWEDQTASTHTPTPIPSSSSSSGVDNAMSTGTMAGIGVGSGVGALIVLGGAAFLFFRRKRAKRRVDQPVAVEHTHGTSTHRGPGKTDGHWYYTQPSQPAELQSDHSYNGFHGCRERDGTVAYELQ